MTLRHDNITLQRPASSRWRDPFGSERFVVRVVTFRRPRAPFPGRPDHDWLPCLAARRTAAVPPESRAALGSLVRSPARTSWENKWTVLRSGQDDVRARARSVGPPRPRDNATDGHLFFFFFYNYWGERRTVGHTHPATLL